jgi:hypothetical protein
MRAAVKHRLRNPENTHGRLLSSLHALRSMSMCAGCALK